MKKNINSLMFSAIIGLSSIVFAGGHDKHDDITVLGVEPISLNPINTKEECGGTAIEGSDGKMETLCANDGGPIPEVSIGTE